jgi:hypothetical protein
MLSVEFLTWLALPRRPLPPGLEPTGNPRVTATVGCWQSNCVGDFDGGAIYLEAKHRKIAGAYVLAMYMNRDQPILYGREFSASRRNRRAAGCCGAARTRAVMSNVMAPG